MKKLMVAALALMVLSGCAANSRYQMAGDLGATVAGAVVGNRVARMTGASNGTLGGVVGAVIAHQVYAGSQVSGTANGQEWWECKPGYGQVVEYRGGKPIASCKKGAPQIARPVAQQQQQVAQYNYNYNGDNNAANNAAYYEGLRRAERRREYENARYYRALGCRNGGGC